MLGLGEGGVSRLDVARIVVPIEDDVGGNVIEKLRRAGRDCIRRLGDRWQWVVFYGTDMDQQLYRRGIRTIVLGGITASSFTEKES